MTETQSVCAICLDELIECKAVSCGHSFHDDCISEWFNKKNVTCPMCRKVVRENVENDVEDESPFSFRLRPLDGIDPNIYRIHIPTSPVYVRIAGGSLGMPTL